MTRSPRELATQKIQLRKQQEKLLTDLLTVVDALDSAAAHWQKAERSQAAPTPSPWWQRWRQWLRAIAAAGGAGDKSDNLGEVVTSARAGTDMIRATMLSVLNQHQVTPLSAEGQPFDPAQMHALGQHATAGVPPNTVTQEVVRGYRWNDRILREAQVIVAVAPAETG